jgi:alpha-N-arabinofuranosidase
MITAQGLPASRPNPVTCTGHADLVQTQGGQWYAVFLGCQPYQAGFYNTGRQTFMLPVEWENEWPRILAPRTAVPLTVKKPNLPADKPAAVPSTGNIEFTDNFDSDSLAFRWIGLRAPTSTWHVASKTAKALFMRPRSDLLSGQANPTYLAVRQQNNNFTCAVTLTAQPKTENCVAGLAAFQNETHFYAMTVKIESGHLAEIWMERPAGRVGRGGRGGPGGGRDAQPTVLGKQKLPDNLVSITLKIEGVGPVTKGFFKAGSGEFTQLGGDLQSSLLSTDTAGGFQGVTLGMFAHY